MGEWEKDARDNTSTWQGEWAHTEDNKAVLTCLMGLPKYLR